MSRNPPALQKCHARQYIDSCPHVRSRWIKKNGSQAQPSLVRSRGGFSTKVHILVDALGYPLRFILTGGARHDITQAENLLASFQFAQVIADKSYDADPFLAAIAAQDATVIIPPRKNRLEQRAYDKHLYQERHLIECFINKIKWFRQIFTRYDKLACRYTAFLHLAATFVWLR